MLLFCTKSQKIKNCSKGPPSKNMRGNTFDAFNLRSTTWSTTLRVTWRHHHRPPLETFKILILRRGSGGLLMSWSEIHGATVISSVNMRNRKNSGKHMAPVENTWVQDPKLYTSQQKTYSIQFLLVKLSTIPPLENISIN